MGKEHERGKPMDEMDRDGGEVMEANGIVTGVVVDLEDPEKLGRVKVNYPHLDGKQSNWARLVSPMAGASRGVFFRPEVGDEVLVAFLHGDMRYPLILGSLWNGKDKPPADDGKAKENNWRFIKSRSGHVIKLDDTKSEETIEIIDKSNKHKIVIDSANKKLRITCDVGDIELKAPDGTILLDAKVIEMKSAENSSLDVGKKLDIRAPQGKATLQAQAIEVSSSKSFKLDAKGAAEMKSSANMTVKGSGITAVEGAMVNVKGNVINLN
jgi:uncharacterized protein involved in type VI secretion and phage assembly